jgi:hypothetical protein
MTHDEIMAAVDLERGRQHAKWNEEHFWGRGDCSTDTVPMVVKAAVLAEEAGEVVKAVLTAGPEESKYDADVRTEVVQTLAVAYAILEGMK